ncbi:hypothetical protein IE53DRAFT_208044 [Violaceomyces palustris]|uniref:Uncharacterized protein n=1 Tax=Violaceomyces palustris TaxID=1673888 RepID=A0ACD0NQU6_9BASI|nr:hypothetical protein IE53DRAFT_208044 [Violaceomyces palustris]
MFLKGPGAGKGDDHDSWSVRPRSSQSQPLNYDLPSLSLVTIFTAQRQNELFGSLLKLPESFRSRLPDEAQNLFLQDQSKAQVLGHSAALAARLAQSAVNHILFAKGQVPETVASLNRQNQVQKDGSVPSRPARAPRSSAWRKREQVLICISRMAAALEEAIRRIQAASDPLACSSKQSPYPSHGGDLEILLVLGPSASSPKELFLLSMKGALLHPHLALGCDADQIGSILADHQVACEKVDPQSRHGTTRVKAREKVSGLLERKLVRFMVSDHQVEEGLGNALGESL